MNAEQLAKRWMEEELRLIQPDERLGSLARALLTAIEALEYYANRMGSGGTAREALAKIRGTWEGE